MKTTKSLFYGLLLVTGLVACSKEYNSNPAGNAGAFGGSNPVAPITGASADEMVLKENGRIIRLKGIKYYENGNSRTIVGGAPYEGTKVVGYTIRYDHYPSKDQLYFGNGKFSDSLFIVRSIGDPADPSGASQATYVSGGLSPNKDVPGYCYSKITDTTGDRMKGEFSGRLIRRDSIDPDKEYNEVIDITSGFFDASKFVP